MPDASGPGPVAARRGRLDRLGWVTRHPDGAALGLLVAIPVLTYLPLLFAGYLVTPGDDLNQNLPLRVLAGEMIRSGRLPAWDPLIWSGTPLLAGWNAGALFPGTFLFAVFGAAFAWACNCIAAPALAATGLYLLLRRHGTRPVGCLAAALVFTYTGFMSGQFVHLGLEQGTALMPWALIGIHLLATASARRQRVGGIALLSAAFGLTLLAGDPRALSSTAIVAVIYGFAVVMAAPAARWRIVGDLLAGAALGAVLGAIQLLPGLTFLSHSQRSSAAYDFFTGGSIGASRLVTQLLVPFLFGGNTNFGLPIYAGDLNLPELTIGSGLVALIATIVYFFVLADRLRARLLGRARVDDGRHLPALFVMGIVGLLLTLGGTLPLAHLLVHVPFFGSERLQNRNAVIFDLPLAILVGYLIDDLGRPDGAARQMLRSWRALLVSLPLVGATALCLDAWGDPQSFARRLRLPPLAGTIAGMHPYYVATIVLGVAVTVAVLVAARLAPRRALLLAMVAVVADVGMYAANAGWATAPTSILDASNAFSRALGVQLGTGRFALYNPGFETPGGSGALLNEIGLTDLNLLHGQASVQGYGSIVSGNYQNVTQTHNLEHLSASAIASSTADTLDLRSLVTLPVYFQLPIASGAPIPLSVAPGQAIHTSGVPGLPPLFSGPWTLSSSAQPVFTLAAPTGVREVTVVLLPAQQEPSRLGIALITPTGTRRVVEVPVVNGKARLTVDNVRTEALQLVGGATPARVGAVVATTSYPSRRLLLDGALQGAVAPPHWRPAGQIGPFTVFGNTRAAGLAWLEAPGASAADPQLHVAGDVQVLPTALGAPQRVEVTTSAPAVLVRSEGYSGGWTARLQPVGGGPTRVLKVQALGLVQEVAIPAGRWDVTFRYAPVSLLAGLVTTIAGLVLLLAMIGWLIRRRAGNNVV